MSSSLVVYGVPLSQPVRAVLWLLLQKRHSFRLVPILPGSRKEGGSRHPDYLSKNPGGTIPCIEEPDTGFVLAESHAILSYLARVNGWNDVYPSDPRAAARIDWYLHYHHRNVRDATIGYIAPAFRPDLKIPEAVLQGAKATFQAALRALDRGWLASSRFLAGDAATIADLAAYVEIGQLRKEFTNLYDFGELPNVQRWLDAMAAVDAHDDSHVVLRELGDIRDEPPAMERIANANRVAMESLAAQVGAFAS